MVRDAAGRDLTIQFEEPAIRIGGIVRGGRGPAVRRSDRPVEGVVQLLEVAIRTVVDFVVKVS
jgi:hypothetical protein